MNDTHTSDTRHGDDGRLRGWGYGLAAWVIAEYTSPRDTVLDLDSDPGLRLAAVTMDRSLSTDLDAVALALADVTLVTAYWPRPTTREHEPDDAAMLHTDLHTLTDIAYLLPPGGHLALVATVPAPTQPFTLRTGHLLAMAFDVGLGQLRGVHGVGVADRDEL